MQTFKIKTLKDIYDLPSIEQVQNCLTDIADCIIKAKELELKTKEIFKVDAKIFDFPESIDWIDDGKHENELRFKMK